jgi:hypothetical protein
MSLSRRRVRAPAAVALCSWIKGNIASNGERIYQLPGLSLYRRTHIDESKGERRSCTELEAQAARWRAAR